MHWRRKWQPFQCSCLGTTRDGGAWWGGVYGVAQSWTRLKQLSSSSRFVITFLPRSKHLLILWLQSQSAVILEPKKIKSVTVSTLSSSVCHEVMGLEAIILDFWMLSFRPAFSLPLSPSRSYWVPLCFLPLEWYNLHTWGCWYFRQPWFQLVSHPAQPLTVSSSNITLWRL